MSDIYENELPGLVGQSGDKLGKWLFVEDVSDMLGVSKRTVFTLLKEGEIKGIKSRKRRLVSTGSVLVYMLRKKTIEINDIKHKELGLETLNNLRVMK